MFNINDLHLQKQTLQYSFHGLLSDGMKTKESHIAFHRRRPGNAVDSVGIVAMPSPRRRSINRASESPRISTRVFQYVRSLRTLTRKVTFNQTHQKCCLFLPFSYLYHLYVKHTLLSSHMATLDRSSADVPPRYTDELGVKRRR